MATSGEKQPQVVSGAEPLPICGIVMPISAIDGCLESHWADVKDILEEAIDQAGFSPQLVSEADEVGIIQKRIIQNLYENPIVVCDVSAKNPNVMFELGLRLAFDKPTIIVKDDKTAYSFDTSPIEHLGYPRDLRFGPIVDFKAGLTEKIKSTHQKAKSDREYTTFLKHFGTFKVAKIATEEVSKETFMLEELKSLRQLIVATQAGRNVEPPTNAVSLGGRRYVICLQQVEKNLAKEVADAISKSKAADVLSVDQTPNDHQHIRLAHNDEMDRPAVMAIARRYVPTARWLGPMVRRPS